MKIAIASAIALSMLLTNYAKQDGSSDVCTACSGDGQLLCCDGCPRAYHLTCCDPPFETVPRDSWFCNKCTGDNLPHPPPAPGIFSGLLGDVHRKSTRSFALPVAIRHYFKGVVTGEDGEYEEASNVKVKR